MKRLLTILLVAFAFSSAFAQDNGGTGIPTGATIEITDQGDTLIVLPPAVDSTLLGRNIINMVKVGALGDVSIRQTSAIETAVLNQIGRNGTRRNTGYRIRIYFDNSQDSRARSSAIASGFAAQHPGVRVYRVYENPYFKVTVGDFRTKSEALRFKKSLGGSYSSMFIVKERINYPAL